jgi:hypothetical protein
MRKRVATTFGRLLEGTARVILRRSSGRPDFESSAKRGDAREGLIVSVDQCLKAGPRRDEQARMHGQCLADPAPCGFTQSGKIRGRALQDSRGRPIAAAKFVDAATGDGDRGGGIVAPLCGAFNAEADA